MPRLLLVEDNQHMQRIFQDKLQREGFSVATANDGALGLQRAREIHPDLILLDIMLPTMDGFEVLTQLRSDPVLSQTPVFMLSNRSSADDMQKADTLGARHFFAKGTSKLQDIAQEIRATCGFKKVLVFSSNQVAAAPILRTLEHPRVLGTVATVLVETVSMAERGAPDLIIIDERASSALTLRNQLKASPLAKTVPIISIANPNQQGQRLGDMVDSSRISTDVRPLVLQRLGLEEISDGAPSQSPQPTSAVA